MKKIVLIIFIFLSSLQAENYSNMSTQELIAIIGYVKASDQKKFKNELKSRVSTMSAKEKKAYKKNLKKSR